MMFRPATEEDAEAMWRDLAAYGFCAHGSDGKRIDPNDFYRVGVEEDGTINIRKPGKEPAP